VKLKHIYICLSEIVMSDWIKDITCRVIIPLITNSSGPYIQLSSFYMRMNIKEKNTQQQPRSKYLY